MSAETRIALGGLVVQRLPEMELPFRSLEELYIDATPEAVADARTWMEPWALCPETGRAILAIQSYLVRGSRHTILIDTCVGCGKSNAWFEPWHRREDRSWLDRLAAAGVRPEEVDYVFCTHLHSDHCGWNTQLVDGRWVPTFPNAKYVMSKAEAAHAEAKGGDSYNESVSPVIEAGQALLVEMDHALDDEVRLEPTPGHTPGHVAVGLASGGQEAVMCGDLMHSPIQCRHPDWRYRIDTDPLQANETRRKFLGANSESGRLVLTAHFPSPSMGRVTQSGEAFDFRFI